MNAGIAIVAVALVWRIAVAVVIDIKDAQVGTVAILINTIASDLGGAGVNTGIIVVAVDF